LEKDDPDWINKYQEMAKRDLARRNNPDYSPLNQIYNRPPPLSWANTTNNLNVQDTKGITNPKGTPRSNHPCLKPSSETKVP
jgi:hypothetical protein